MPACVRNLIAMVLAVVAALAPAARAQEKAGGPQPAAVPAGRQASKVAVITVYDGIDGIMARSIKRRIDQAAAAGFDAIVFDLNCPGGEVGAVLEISSYIKNSPIANTVAWVHPAAISGAAVMALACREIVIDDHCTFGDAMPITVGTNKYGGWGVKVLTDADFAKYMGPLVADVVESTRRYNTTFGGYLRDEYLLEAIVANDLELWWVRNKETGVKMAIDKEEFRMLFPGESMSGPARMGAAGAARAAAPVPHGATPEASYPTDSAKLAGVAGEVSTLLSGTVYKTDRPRLTEADAGKWELLSKINDGKLTLTFKPDDMLYFGLCSNETQVSGGKTVIKPIHSDAELASFMGARTIARADMSWSENMAGFLSNFVVKGVLIVIFLIALFIEMTHPGTIVPGCTALLALILLVGPSFLEGMSGWWTALAIVSGLVLLGIEAFVIPGFGVAGVLGMILLFAGLVGTFVPGGGAFTTPQGQSDMLWGATTVLLAGGTAGFGMWMLAKHFGSLPVLGRLVLKNPSADDESESVLTAMDPDPDSEVLPGEIGTALTPLRPAGRVDMGDRVVDAISEFGFIPAGAKVRIVSVSQMRIGVEPVRKG